MQIYRAYVFFPVVYSYQTFSVILVLFKKYIEAWTRIDFQSMGFQFLIYYNIKPKYLKRCVF